MKPYHTVCLLMYKADTAVYLFTFEPRLPAPLSRIVDCFRDCLFVDVVGCTLFPSQNN